MTPILIPCPTCKDVLQTSDPALAGQTIKCPRCGALAPVPAAASASAVAAPAASPEALDASPRPAAVPADGSAAPRSRLPMRTRRLLADAEQMGRELGRSSLIRIQSTVGNPPELYRIEYQVQGLARGPEGRPVARDSHLVEIQLTSEYPRVSPKCKVLTPIFHPNIDPTTICVGDHWAAGERLVDLVVRIGEMIAYQAYNIKSPLDGEAAMWADCNQGRLPIDTRDLHPPAAPAIPAGGGVAPVCLETAFSARPPVVSGRLAAAADRATPGPRQAPDAPHRVAQEGAALPPARAKAFAGRGPTETAAGTKRRVGLSLLVLLVFVVFPVGLTLHLASRRGAVSPTPGQPAAETNRVARLEATPKGSSKVFPPTAKSGHVTPTEKKVEAPPEIKGVIAGAFGGYAAAEKKVEAPPEIKVPPPPPPVAAQPTPRIMPVKPAPFPLAKGGQMPPPIPGPEQRFLFVSSDTGNREIVRLTLRGTAVIRVQNLTNHPAQDECPAYSPDGRQIAFCSNRDGAWNLYVMDADGGNVRQVTRERANSKWPSWAPDGKRLAYRRALVWPKAQVFVVNVDGSNPLCLSKPDTFDFDAAWSPDGRRVAFSSNREGKHFRVYAMDANGANVQLLTAEGSRLGHVYPAWSPDGARLAYGGAANNGVELFVCSSAGRETQQLTRLGGVNLLPSWSPDGRRLAFVHRDAPGSASRLYLMNADGSDLQPITGLRVPFDLSRLVWEPRTTAVAPRRPWAFVPPKVQAAKRGTADWPGFRGPDGAAVSGDTDVPVQWSPDNRLWKVKLPGLGASSPILYKDKVFVTAYTGYGTTLSRDMGKGGFGKTGKGIGADTGGDQNKLRLLVLCLDRNTGRKVWQQELAPKLPEVSFRGFVREHGYASSTPVTDGEHLYVFFGKTGVVAYDLMGKQLWQADVGSSTDPSGSASSPIVVGNLVIVNAAIESKSLVALDKLTGQEVWRARGLGPCWTSPLLVATRDGQYEVVLSLPGKLVGYDPETGKELWRCQGIGSGFGSNTSSTPVARDGVVYVIGGGVPTAKPTAAQPTALAVRAGGRGDVSQTHVLWRQKAGTGISSPVLSGDYLCWAAGAAHCLRADNGEVVYRQSLYDGRGEYVSPVAVGDKIFVLTRFDGLYVLAGGDKFQKLAHHEFEGDDSIFNASPAVGGGGIYVRSNEYLYCIGKR